MSQETLDLRRFLRLVRQHKIVLGIFVALGLLAGVAFGVLRPAMLVSESLVYLPPSVVLPPSTQGAAAQGAGTDPGSALATQVVIAASDPVLGSALPRVDPAMSLQTLRGRIRVKSLTSNILSISAEAKTAAQAEGTANAVADSYVAYVSSGKIPGEQVQARVLQPATTAAGTSLSFRLLVTGGLGTLIGALIGAIAVRAFSRSDRRLRDRDEIANAIGVPVLASIPVARPSDASRWARLLAEYEPAVVHAWQSRNALRYLAQAHAVSSRGSNGDMFNYAGNDDDSLSVAVISLSSDRGALALGPQLAVYAASRGIPTALVIGPQQDAKATAALRAACAEPLQPPTWPSQLHVAVADHDDSNPRQPRVKLTVIVAVVDGQDPRVADTMRASATVLGVSASAATAAQLADVAFSAASDGRQIDGILVADPDPADRTSGRVPQLARPAQRRMPTRMTGIPTETRR